MLCSLLSFVTFEKIPDANSLPLKSFCVCFVLSVCLFPDLFGNSKPLPLYPAPGIITQCDGMCGFFHADSIGDMHLIIEDLVDKRISREDTSFPEAAEYGTNFQDQDVEPDSLMTLSSGCNPGHILNNDSIACSGSVVELKSRNALTYNWIPSAGLSNPNVQNPWLMIDSTLTYYLETTEYTNNLVVNPGFDLGDSGFITTYTKCNSANCLSPLGDNGYAVGTDANYFHSYFTGKDHTTGSGNFMIINGAQPALTVWQQTVPVKPNTKYAFGVWISTMISLSPAQIQFSINGGQVGALYNAPVYAGMWDQVFTTWNSGSVTTATIKVVDILPILEGNDFGLDDFFFGEVVSCSDSVTLTASENVNLGNDTVISPGKTVVLSPKGGFFSHYTWSTGDTTQTAAIFEAGTYSLTVADPRGCNSTDTVNVMNSMSFVVFPNAFSPNADRQNDVFRPRGSNVGRFEMSVYNRWGQLLFETSDITSGWNGTLDGKDCTAGLYFYVASYELPETHEAKTTRGSFTLIR